MRALLAAALLALPAGARALEISAEVNKVLAELGDQLVLAVTVSGTQASLPKPRLPALADFEAYESGTSQSFSFVNGRTSSSVTYTYVLQPRRKGKLRVPAITVQAGGRAASTEPIDIQVVDPAPGAPAAPPRPAAPPGSPVAPRAPADPTQRPEVFLTATLDKPRAYVGEQVTLAVRFHTSVSLVGDVQYDAPKLEGFLTEDLGQSQSSEQIGSRSYHVTEVRTALFPVHAGRLAIGAAQARAQAAKALDPFASDLFERFFSMGAVQPLTLRSDPLALEALPLPAEGKPEGFSGAVGRFRLKASVDRTRLKVGEAATLTVEISGTGNLRSAGEPARPEAPALRFYDTESSVRTEKGAGQVGGVKTLKTVFVPRASGPATIPPLTLWYFDPAEKRYEKAQSEPIALDVAPGDPGAAGPAGPGAAPGLGIVSRDIRYLKAGPMRSPASRALEAFAGLGAAHGVPALLLAGSLLADWRRRRLEADPAGARARSAAARARAALDKAASAADAVAAAAAVSEALAGYVADRCGTAPAGLTLKRCRELLGAGRRPVPAPAFALFAEAWRDAEAVRFAPPGAAEAAAAAVAQKARAALDALEAA